MHQSVAATTMLQDNGDTVLANAAFHGHTDVVAMLISRGANVNAVNRFDGDSALMWASVNGHFTVCDLLLRAGANVNIENKKGVRALFRAAYKGYPEIVKLLLVAGAEPRAKTVCRACRLQLPCCSHAAPMLPAYHSYPPLRRRGYNRPKQPSTRPWSMVLRRWWQPCVGGRTYRHRSASRRSSPRLHQITSHPTL